MITKEEKKQIKIEIKEAELEIKDLIELATSLEIEIKDCRKAIRKANKDMISWKSLKSKLKKQIKPMKKTKRKKKTPKFKISRSKKTPPVLKRTKPCKN